MGGVGPQPAFLASEQRGHSGSVDDPARADFLALTVLPDFQALDPAGLESDFADGDGPAHFNPQGGGTAQHLLVEHSPIDLERGHARQVTPADLAAVVQSKRLFVVKPEAHPLLDQVRFVQMLSQTQDPPQKVAADFYGSLTNSPAENGRFFQHQDAQLGQLALEQQSGGRSGQSATD